MINTSSYIAIFVLATAACTFGQATVGQQPTKEFALTYRNIDKLPSGHWTFSLPEVSNTIGKWSPTGPNAPGGVLPTSTGLLEFTMPTGQFWTIGIEITEFLYTDSTAASFDDFGSLNNPSLLPVNHYPLDYPAGAKMWQHLSDSTMWAFNMGPPDLWTSWLTTFPPVSGPGPFMTIEPLGGPGNFFSQIMSALPVIAVPPQTSPGGGGLIGMNVILQIAVAENAPLPPNPTRYLMSNSWGLQAMAAPVLKINAGSGGNFGPAGARRELDVLFPNVGAKVQLPALDGSIVDVPTGVIDGSTLGYIPRDDTMSGPIDVVSPTGPTAFERPLVHIITQGDPVDIAIDLPVEDQRVIDGILVSGFSIFGTATDVQTVVNVPAYPGGEAYDAEIKFYALDRTNNVAGYDDGNPSNATIPVEANAAPAGTPVMTQPLPPGTPIGNGASVRSAFFSNLTGSYDLAFRSGAGPGSTFSYLLVVRTFPTGTFPTTP